ncbi:MAG: DUF4115 domain-containing protein [Alphaproteobacteria bacterium]|nr:DUF4115 domain-containing protein [Alphaproteobacteria bacterium]
MTENIEKNDVVEVPVELSAGEMLRNARTTGRRKREIPTISKQLCIREEFLEALENGDYGVIPEPVYILGFARNYAMELGLNPDEIVNKIKKEMGMVSDCAAADDDEDVSACAMPSIKEESWGKVAFGKMYQFIYQHWIWFAVGVVALIAIVATVLMLSSATEEVEQPAEVAPVVETTIKEPEYKQEVRERYGTKNREKANVILQAAKESWVKIEDGRGNTVISQVLVPGDVYYVPAGDNYKATFGNAGGIDVWVNGVLVPDVGPDNVRKTGISLAPDKLVAGQKE